MAKDDRVNESHTTNDAPRMSVRQAIISARDEVMERDEPDREKDEIDEVKEKRVASDKSEKPEPKKPDKDDVDTEEVSDNDEEDAGDDDTTEEVKEEKPKVTAKAPPGWTKEAKEEWDALSDNVRAAVLKREKEVSDGFAGTKQTQDRLREFDTALGPYYQSIQQIGVSPPQLVSKLLETYASISHPNKEFRTRAFKELARSFNVDLDNQSQEDNSQQVSAPQEQQEIPYWAQEIIQQQRATQQRSTEDFVNSWAYAKGADGNLLRPHYANEQIRQSIAGLISTGAVPLENGNITHGVLDAAYQKAIRTDDNIWNQLQEEKQEAEAAKKRADAEKKAKQIRDAKAKGVSLRPGAPTNSSGSSANGQTKPGNHVSVRDSINAAIREQMG